MLFDTAKRELSAADEQRFSDAAIEWTSSPRDLICVAALATACARGYAGIPDGHTGPNVVASCTGGVVGDGGSGNGAPLPSSPRAARSAADPRDSGAVALAELLAVGFLKVR